MCFFAVKNKSDLVNFPPEFHTNWELAMASEELWNWEVSIYNNKIQADSTKFLFYWRDNPPSDNEGEVEGGNWPTEICQKFIQCTKQMYYLIDRKYLDG
jgi:hypothetical protein